MSMVVLQGRSSPTSSTLSFRRYALPSRQYFSRTEIPRLYREVSGQVKTTLENVEHYAVTTDMWSSRTQDPYMAVTVHYIDHNWSLNAKMLQVGSRTVTASWVIRGQL